MFAERIVILDGAMGTMIQQHKLDEAAFRGERFKDWPHDLKGCNDLLVLTKPELIEDIHRQFLEAGADIIATNTFNATSLSLADYHLEELVYELNCEAVKLARRVADARIEEVGPHLLRGRRPGADQQDGFHFARRQRSGFSRGHLRSSSWRPTAMPRAVSSRAARMPSSSKPFSTR